jgi:glycogen synthase
LQRIFKLFSLFCLFACSGIMNGIDTIEWDPSTDPHLPTEGRFDVNTFTRGKAFMKAALQRRLGLKEDSNAALAVFVGRLTEQKGVDLLLGTIPVLFAGSPSGRPQIGSPSATHHSGDSQPRDVHAPPPPLQMAMLGSGEQWMQTALSGLSHLYPGQAVGVPCFSEELAHWMLAAADYVLVPSRFEPCGLVAQCGARYGAVPIVNAVGGLKDLVSPDVGLALPAPSSTGGAAERRVDVHRWAEALRGAAKDAGEPLHRAMQRRGMSLDLSWRGPALEWERVLHRLASLRSAKEQHKGEG